MSVYLILYNCTQLCGWCFFFFRVTLDLINSKSLQEIYSNSHIILQCFQYGAFLETIHAILGIVKTSVLPTILQMLIRTSTVFLLQFVPTALSYGYLIIYFAWSLVEIVRYLYYTLNLIKKDFGNFNVPYIFIWCRYTFSVMLYPIGFVGEFLTFWNARKHFNKYILWENNAFNISRGIFFYPIYILFIPGFYFMYGHLISQRKKVFKRLNNGNIKNKKIE